MQREAKTAQSSAGSVARSAPPRIYYLDGAVAAEETLHGHLARVADLGFDWICRAVADDAARSAGRPGMDRDLPGVARKARARGLQTMVETRCASTKELARHLENGAQGLLIDTAARAGAGQWRQIREELRRAAPEATICATAFGRPFEEVTALAGVGFDYLVSSSGWWDFRQPWFVEQQRQLSGLTRTIASVEPLRGGRLTHRIAALDARTREAAYRAHYLLAAVASSGLICPMGFEIGMAALLDSRTSRPADWDYALDQAPFDLSEDIKRVNGLMAHCPALAGEPLLRRASAPDAPVLALVAAARGEDVRSACLVINTTRLEQAAPSLSDLAMAAGAAAFDDALSGQRTTLRTLAPHEARLLLAVASKVRRAADPGYEPERRLRALAENRVVIERVSPEIDGGRFPVKRVLGDRLSVEADIFCDGHDVIDAAVRYRPAGAGDWQEAPMHLVDNDRWAGEVALTDIGRWSFTIVAWRDLFSSWRQEVAKKLDADRPIALELTEGRRLVERYAKEAEGKTKKGFASLLKALERHGEEEGELLALLMSEETAALMRRAEPRTNLSRQERDLEVTVDRPVAACAAWYEMMPRSQSPEPGAHGTFDDVIARLPYVRDLGFDVLYFPPIHPIGRTNRKGRNNTLTPGPHDPGSPYAIGSQEGGHTSLHPELGDLEDFRRLVRAARGEGLEIALDFAIQCAPDHPWIKEHPEWFDWRPDGSIKFAENPPKRYEDIVNVHFYRDALPGLWLALRDVVRFWIGEGVRIFRVDNPHTKPVPFWEWLIRDIQDRHPDAIFLSEAFTRPKMMKRLAKVGFAQSYSYFTWRNAKPELTDYLTELTEGEAREYMRPNFFVNTPDINPVYLQTGGRPAHQVRLVLAAMLSPLYGVYNGFELCEATPIPGKEEYLNSEKYEIKAWDWDRPGNIRDDIRLINRIRRDNPALWRFANLTFLNAWSPDILAWYKTTEARDNLVIVAVNLDPRNAHGADFEVPLWELGLADDASMDAVDLVEDKRFTWYGKRQHVWLDPVNRPYAIWRFASGERR